MAICLDNLIRNQSQGTHTRFNLTSTTTPEPLQIGCTRTSPEERRCHQSYQLCFYRRQAGHRCEKSATKTNKVSQFLYPLSVQLPTHLYYVITSYCVPTLVDSGSSINLIPRQLVDQLQIPTVIWTVPLWITAVDNQPIGSGVITHQTIPFTLQIGLFHSSTAKQINRFPLAQRSWSTWLSWTIREHTQWSPHCQDQCFWCFPNMPCLNTYIESPEECRISICFNPLGTF